MGGQELAAGARALAWLGAALAVVAMALAAGCAGESDKSAAPAAAGSPAAQGPLPGSPPGPLPAELQQMLADVVSIRGLPAPASLDVSFIARADLPALLDRLLTHDDRRWYHNTTTLYRLLGLLRNDQDYLSVYNSFGSDAILGLYSPPDKRLWVVTKDGKAEDASALSRDEKATLAHELVHALQDASFDLDTTLQSVLDDLDRNLAYTAVIEGDAVTHERLYAQRFALGTGAGRLAAFALAPRADVPPGIERELRFPYSAGADWVTALRARSGTARIDELLRTPPSATALILHPALFDSGWRPRPVSLPNIAGALGAGWARESGGTLGEFELQNELLLRLRSIDATTAAAGWDGDHYDVYVSGGRSLAVFRVFFRDAEEAAAFAAAQRHWLEAAGADLQAPAGVTVGAVPGGATWALFPGAGDSVTFVAGSDRDAVEHAVEGLIHG